MRIVILDGYTTNPNDLDWDPLERLGDLTVYDWTEPEEVILRARDAQIIFTNKVRLDDEIFAKLPELRYIGILATGTDCVDLKAAAKRGIAVSNVPVYADYSVPQLAFALILELCYKTGLHSKVITEDLFWCRQKYNSFWLSPLVGLEGKTLGIIGLGKIGQRMASIGTAFGMNISAYDAFPREIPGISWLSLEELLQGSDIVTIHCPLLPSTRGMINKTTLSMMKPSAFFINTSRGPLMVDEDVADALNREFIAGAGLDVLGSEPPRDDNPLLKAKNVVITPHIGWATVEARRKLILEGAKNLYAFLNNESRNRV